MPGITSGARVKILRGTWKGEYGRVIHLYSRDRCTVSLDGRTSNYGLPVADLEIVSVQPAYLLPDREPEQLEQEENLDTEFRSESEYRSYVKWLFRKHVENTPGD